MNQTRAPRRLSDAQRKKLFLICNEARDAADNAASHASVATMPDLLFELHRSISANRTALDMLQVLAEAEERADDRLAA